MLRPRPPTARRGNDLRRQTATLVYSARPPDERNARYRLVLGYHIDRGHVSGKHIYDVDKSTYSNGVQLDDVESVDHKVQFHTFGLLVVLYDVSTDGADFSFNLSVRFNWLNDTRTYTIARTRHSKQ